MKTMFVLGDLLSFGELYQFFQNLEASDKVDQLLQNLCSICANNCDDGKWCENCILYNYSFDGVVERAEVPPP